ncbi:MAG: thioester reductase domain-containing protein, partial [Planctomycetota bacterium]
MTLALPHLGGGDSDLSWLVGRVADLLGVPVELVDPDAPLFELGLDSVTAVELTEELRQRFAVSVPDTLLYEHPSPRAAIGRLLGGTPTSGVDPRSDASLPAEITPAAGPAPSGPPRHLLMTGATGFLGAQALAEILERTEARVTCLIRGGDRARVLEALSSRGLEGAEDRIEVLGSDLEQPGLGLDAFTWARLSEEVDAVLHLAAKVDWVSPYAALRPSNAGGTRELLRLACEHRPKAFHFCSSISVLYARDGVGELDEGAEPLEQLDGLDLGYAAGKAVAEELVLEAGRRGLPITILRPSLIAGDSVTGAGNPGDFLSALMKGCIQLGLAPDLDWN